MLTVVKKRFDTLDSFRGICAILVVCYHARILLSFTEATFFRNGHYFVEFFFVLSGFVLFHTYGEAKFTKDKFKQYLTSRFFRLYPMHILTLIVVIIIEFIKLYAGKKGITFNNAAFTETARPADIIPNLLLLHAWLPNATSTSFNMVSWSISIEFYMYIIFGGILLLGDKIKHYFFALIMLSAFALLFIDFSLIKGEVLRGLSCFFAGCLSYLVYKKLAAVNGARALFTILELILIATIVMVLAAELPHKTIAVTIVFCLTVITFALERGAISDLFKLSPFTFLGKLSYSIYITHYIILFCVIASAIIFTKVTGVNFTIVENIGGTPTRFITTHHLVLDHIILFVVLGVVILISNFTYNYVERKGISFGKQLNVSKGLNKSKAAA